jgi:hypothetical protein
MKLVAAAVLKRKVQRRASPLASGLAQRGESLLGELRGLRLKPGFQPQLLPEGFLLQAPLAELRAACPSRMSSRRAITRGRLTQQERLPEA